jgi:peptide chain release factor 3
VGPETKGEVDRFADAHGSAIAKDLDGVPVFMADGRRYEQERWPDLRLAEIKTYEAG